MIGAYFFLSLPQKHTQFIITVLVSDVTIAPFLAYWLDAVSGKELAKRSGDDTPIERHRRSEIIDEWTMTLTRSTFTRL